MRWQAERLSSLLGQRTNVWVVDLCEKADLWRGHWVFFGQEQLQLKGATYAAQGGMDMV